MRYSVALLVLVLAGCKPSAPPAPPPAPTAPGVAGGGTTTTTVTSSCSARSDAGKSCTVTCQAGESAACENATAPNEPSCRCVPAK